MISVVFVIFGLAEDMLVSTAISASVLAAIVGLASLWRNHMEGLFKEDPLYMMQLLFYFGLLIFSIGEATIAASILFPDDMLISHLPGLTRTFGMIFWLLGVLNYIRATNKVLEFIDFKVWILLIFICSLVVLIVGTSVYSTDSTSSIITSINLIVFTLGTGIMTSFILSLGWIFRKGELRNFLLALFSSLFFMLIRSIVVAYSTNALLALVSLTLALETYVCIWISESLLFQMFHS